MTILGKQRLIFGRIATMEAVYMNHTEPDDIYAAVLNTVRENVDYIWGMECETLKVSYTNFTYQIMFVPNIGLLTLYTT